MKNIENKYKFIYNIDETKMSGIIDTDTKQVLCYCNLFQYKKILKNIENNNPQILSEELKHFSNWLVNQNIMISETINGNRWRENKMGYGYINHEVLVDRYLSDKSNPTVKFDDVGEIVEYIGNNNNIRGKHYTLLAIEDDYGALCKWGSETMRFRVDEIKLVFKRK